MAGYYEIYIHQAWYNIYTNTLIKILFRKLEYNETVHQLFIDFKKAHDSVRREVLCNILIEFGIPMKLVRVIQLCLNDAYSKVRIGNHLSDSFPIQSGLKQGDALSPLLFNVALKYAIRRFQENQVGLKSNGTDQRLPYADDMNLLGGNIEDIKQNRETLIVASNEAGLKVNVEKTRYTLVSRHQDAGQNHKNTKQAV
jgi:hypothetical protein